MQFFIAKFRENVLLLRVCCLEENIVIYFAPELNGVLIYLRYILIQYIYYIISDVLLTGFSNCSGD